MRHPFVDYHPGPGDATAAFAYEAMERVAGTPEAADGDRVTTTVTTVESPSVQIAWGLRMNELKVSLPFVPFYESVQQPDPRVPKGDVQFVLWSYDRTTARPSVGAPDPAAGQAVAAIAQTRYNLQTWFDAAYATAQRFGPAWIQHLTAVMLHPPIAPDHIHPLDWVPRVQTAAALIVGASEGGFSVIRDIALGPADWVVDAAVVVLGELALRNPNLRGEVEQVFGVLRQSLPQEGYTSYAYPLALTWLRLVPPSDPRHAELQGWLQRIVRGQEGGTTSSGCIGLIDGINMEDYAEFCVKQTLLQQSGKTGQIAALAQEYGVHGGRGIHRLNEGWAEAINRHARLGLAFAQTKARIQLALQGIDPDSEEARLSHNLMAGKGLDQEEEMRKAQAAQAQLQAGADTDPDPTVFPGKPVAKLSDYVSMMKKMQGGDFNGALSAYGLDMGTYSLVMQAWGTKLGVDPSLNAKFGKMMAG